MNVCRVIFRKTTGDMLLRIIYHDNTNIPDLEQELEDFAVLNGYNVDALIAVDKLDTDAEFENMVKAETIKYDNGNLIYTFPDIPEPTRESDPVIERLDLLIQMQLEREGII